MGEIIKKTASDTGGAKDHKDTESTVPKDESLAYSYITKHAEEKIAESEKRILSKIKKYESETDKKIEKAKEEQERNKIGTIEALAVFVALFTFVSINITIFSRIEYLSAALWFMILMAISQILILIVFLIFLHQEHKKWKNWLLPLLLIGILIGLLLASMNNDKLNPQINKIEIPDTQEETD